MSGEEGGVATRLRGAYIILLCDATPQYFPTNSLISGAMSRTNTDNTRHGLMEYFPAAGRMQSVSALD